MDQPVKSCAKCGEQNFFDAQFCLACGAALSAQTFTPPPPIKKKSSVLIWVFIVPAVMCGGCGALSFLTTALNANKPNQTSSSALTSGTAPSSTSQSLPTATPKPVKPEELRESLKASYELTMSLASPNLNYIKTKYTKTRGGYALWAVHTYYGRYSFDIGPLASEVRDWMSANYSDLEKAGVVRVGVMDAQGYSGSAWFDLR